MAEREYENRAKPVCNFCALSFAHSQRRIPLAFVANHRNNIVNLLMHKAEADGDVHSANIWDSVTLVIN